MKQRLRLTFQIIFFISPLSLFAQDLIVKKNGDEVKAKVLEISVTEIKYKNFENIDGPLYTIPKQDVLFIRYQNGTKEIISAENSSPNLPATSVKSTSTVEDKTEQGSYKVIAFYGIEYFTSGFLTVTGQRYWNISKNNKVFLGLMIRGSLLGRTLDVKSPGNVSTQTATENIIYVPLACRYYFKKKFYAQADLGPQYVYYSLAVKTSAFTYNTPSSTFGLGGGTSVGYTGPKGWDWSLKYYGIGGAGIGMAWGGGKR